MRPEDWDGEDMEDMEDAEWCPCERCGETWELSDLRQESVMMICPDCRQELKDENCEKLCVVCGTAWHVDDLTDERVCPDCIEEYERK